MTERNDTGRAGQVFLLALCVAGLVFLPFVIMDRGYFIFYGDFNVQQIPFYRLAHEAVRSGDVFWSWYTDLGANFIGSYSFYLLFSPFFWLTLPFPPDVLPFLMAPLLVLKTACAALTAYLYLSRFVRDKNYAVLGSLLYAFSGWMDYNIFFNHFHEAAVFFPLLLLGVEKLVMEDRKGFFALIVAINAMVNYWFFVGEAVFVVIYVMVRMTDRTFGMTLRKFLRLAAEAVLGVGLAAAVLLPSVMALMGNPRAGMSELVTGWGAWLYWHEQRLPAILQSLLFPPDLPARPNFFPDHGAKWASLSAWLPMMGLTGVLAYFFGRKDDWIKKILALCLLFALVPGLNSLFILLNNSYYARWFYMPLLLMAMASIRALEDSVHGTAYFRRAVWWVGVLILVFALVCGATPWFDEGELQFGLAHDWDIMWIYVAVALLGTLATAFIILRMRYHRNFIRVITVAVAVFSVGFGIFFIGSGKYIFERSDFVINTAIGGREQIDLPGETFARSDAYDTQDNLLMFWGLPNIQAFHSIVPASIMEFYPEIGVTRDVGSRPEAEFYAIRPLLSVRWLFIESENEEQNPMPGYTKYAEQAGFNIYKNDNFLPMGFAYDSCVNREELELIPEKARSNMMLRAVVLDDDTIERNSDILWHIGVSGEERFSFREMERDVAERREFTADSFAFDTHGFSASTSFDDSKLLFFSVPWEKGWSAYVNGAPVRIERANIGFMAVRVPPGSCDIRFEYMTPGLFYGVCISAVCALIFLVYLLVAILAARKRKLSEARAALAGDTPIEMSGSEYLKKYGDKQGRAARLQRALNEAEAKHMPEVLEENERTFNFSTEGMDNQEISGKNNTEMPPRG